MPKHMLSTVDNPYNPFKEFAQWYAYDEAKGYHSCSYLARLVFSSEDISQADQDFELESAIDEIVKEDVLGIYMKVAEDSS